MEFAIEYCSFTSMLNLAFPDHCQLENAQNQLNALARDMTAEPVSGFKNGTSTLFNKGGIDRWIQMRPYLLRAITEDLRRELGPDIQRFCVWV